MKQSYLKFRSFCAQLILLGFMCNITGQLRAMIEAPVLGVVQNYDYIAHESQIANPYSFQDAEMYELIYALFDHLNTIVDFEVLPDAVKNCIVRFKGGQTVFDKHELHAGLTYIVNDLENITRAPRPSATASPAIVGPNICCDLAELKNLLLAILFELQEDFINLQISLSVCCNEIIASLSSLRCSATATVDLSGVYTAIADVKNSLTECCSTMTADFAGVFTSLANLNVTASVDLSGVYTSLVNIKNTLTECCSTMTADFAGVFTSLANLNVTASVDLSGVYTSLVNIKNTLTECCSTMTVDFAGVFTALADIKNTITVDFAGVFTVLNNLNVTASIDLSGVYTSLVNIKNTLTECCSTMTVDFAGVFTALADIKNTMTIDFAGVFTVLNNLNVTASIDLSGVYTSLVNIKNTLTECCSTMTADFAGVFTTLANLNLTITFDLSGVYTSLADIKNTMTIDFAGVFTSLIDIKNTLTECCSTMTADFAGIFTTLANLNLTITFDLSGVYTSLADIKNTMTVDFAGTWTILAGLQNNFCNPVFIKQSDFGAGGVFTYTISTAGVYKLAENITYNGTLSPAILITSSNVILDLQCFGLNYGGATANITGVRVNASLNDVTIQNGMIQNFTDAGINVLNTVQRFNALDMVILACQTGGIQLNGTSASAAISESSIMNVNMFQCSTAATATAVLLMNFCRSTKVINCRLTDNGVATHDLSVVSVLDSQHCSFNDLFMNNNAGQNNFEGMKFQRCIEMTVQNCTQKNNISAGNARGFALESNTTCTANKFIDCTVMIMTGTAQVDAFFTGTGCNNNIFMNCQALATAASGSGTTAIARGFNFVNNSCNIVMNSVVNTNNASASTASPYGAYGFDLNTTFSNTLMFNVVTCLNGGTSSVGFNVVNGSNNSLRGNQAENTSDGYRLNPAQAAAAGVLHSFLQNIATMNPTNNYNGFPNANRSLQATRGNTNGLTNNPWTNIGLG